MRVVFQQPGVDEAFARQLSRLRPDVALVEVAEGSIAEWVARLKASPEPPTVIALDRTADAGTILAAFRAGADDFLHPPLEENLRRVLERESARRQCRAASAGCPGKIAGFVSVKGGCGGTTVACAGSIELAARQGAGVLLMDADFEAGLVAFLTGVRSPHSVTEAMGNLHRLDLDYWSALVSEGPEGLRIIPARPAGGLKRARDAEALQAVLRFVRAHYNWIMVDLGTGLNASWRAAGNQLDVLFLVTTLDVPALYRCTRTLGDLEAAAVDKSRVRVVANQVGAIPSITRLELEKIVDMPVECMIPEDSAAMRRWHAGERSPAKGGAFHRCITEVVDRLSGAPPEASPGPLRARDLLRAACGLLQLSARRA